MAKHWVVPMHRVIVVLTLALLLVLRGQVGAVAQPLSQDAQIFSADCVWAPVETGSNRIAVLFRLNSNPVSDRFPLSDTASIEMLHASRQFDYFFTTAGTCVKTQGGTRCTLSSFDLLKYNPPPTVEITPGIGIGLKALLTAKSDVILVDSSGKRFGTIKASEAYQLSRIATGCSALSARSLTDMAIASIDNAYQERLKNAGQMLGHAVDKRALLSSIRGASSAIRPVSDVELEYSVILAAQLWASIGRRDVIGVRAIVAGYYDEMKTFRIENALVISDLDGKTALHWAAQLGYPEIVAELVEYYEWTSEHPYQSVMRCAIQSGNIEVVARLMREEGFARAVRGDSNDLRDFAKRLGHDQISYLLR